MTTHDERAQTPGGGRIVGPADVDDLARSMLELLGHDEDEHATATGTAPSSWSKAPDFADDPKRAAAVREATERDRQRYLTAGLVSVDCRFCHVAVQVKKLGPEHTSVQWSSEATRRCAVFAEIRESGGDPARARSCSRLTDSIKHAVAEGCLEEVSSAPSPLGLLAGCTRVIDTAAPQPVPRVGPIMATQVGDLLSGHVQDKDGNRFVTVEPESCAGVAREHESPFIVDHHPAAIDGGHWVVTDGREVYIEEIAAVYPSDYDAGAALDAARSTIASCQNVPFSVTSMQGREYHFSMLPPEGSHSPDIVLWSFRSIDWACDNALVAAHNAAVELTTCGPANGYDVASLATDTLKRIEALANTAA